MTLRLMLELYAEWPRIGVDVACPVCGATVHRDHVHTHKHWHIDLAWTLDRIKSAQRPTGEGE